MRAVIYQKYGSPNVLQMTEIEKPVTGDREVRIRVHATSVSPIDWHFRSGSPFLARIMAGGFFKPKINILGFDVAGEIESVGKAVKRWTGGEQVYGYVPPRFKGANAEYVCIPEENIILKPEHITYEEAAVVPNAAIVAWWFLKEGGLKSGQNILINGASGGLGIFAIQIAKSIGAGVTGVCSTANLDMVRSLGADEVIDYMTEDFTKIGRTYDLIFDAVGKSSYPNCKRCLNEKGVYISTILTFQGIFYIIWTTVFGDKRAMAKVAQPNPQDLVFVNDLVNAGKMKPVIDSIYSLEQIAEAHRYAENGHVKGKVVVKVGGTS